VRPEVAARRDLNGPADLASAGPFCFCLRSRRLAIPRYGAPTNDSGGVIMRLADQGRRLHVHAFLERLFDDR